MSCEIRKHSQILHSLSPALAPALTGLIAAAALALCAAPARASAATGGPLAQQAKLTAFEGVAGERLGSSLAGSEGTVIIGAPDATVGPNAQQGAVYVFTASSASATGWIQSAKLTVAGGLAGERLGAAVAISGSTIVAGAPGAGAGRGVVYVFSEPASGWASGTQAAKLITGASDVALVRGLGESVAISGSTVVAGAPDTDVMGSEDQGAAYVYSEPVGGWAGDVQDSARLTASDGSAGDLLGASVSISGATVAAGAPDASGGGAAGQGVVYVFSEPATGWASATQSAELTASDTEDRAALGEAVALAGPGEIVAGAPNAPGGIAPGPGAAYVFTQSGAGWRQSAQLTASDGSEGDRLGSALAVSPTGLVAGAPNAEVGSNAAQGAAYVFGEPASGWANATQSAKLTASDGAASDGLGSAVALTGSSVAAGAPGARIGSNAAQGAAYVFAPPPPEASPPPPLPPTEMFTRPPEVPAPQPSAAFTGPSARTLHIDRAALFDAAPSEADGSTVRSFTWFVRGAGVDGRSAGVTCGGDTSELETSFQGSGTVAVTLRVNSEAGRLTTVTHDFTVSGTAKPWRGPHVSQWFLCRRGPGDPAVKVTENGGPPAGCQETATYQSGNSEVVGCFEVVEGERFRSPGTHSQAAFELENSKIQAWDLIRETMRERGEPWIGEVKTPIEEAKAHSHGKLPQVRAAASSAPAGSVSSGSSGPPFLIAYSEIRLNGVDLTPAANNVVLLDMRDSYVASSQVTVSVHEGKMVLRRNAQFVTSTFNVNGDQPALDTNVEQLKSENPSLASFFDLGGFPVTGNLTFSKGANGETTILANIELPAIFTNGQGERVTLPIEGEIDNSTGLPEFNHIGAILHEAWLGPPQAHLLEVRDARFCYQRHVSEDFCQKQAEGKEGTKEAINFGGYEGSSEPSWDATMELILGDQAGGLPGATIDAAPPPPESGVGFVGGKLAFAGALASWSPGIPIFTGVELNKLGFHLGLNPFRASGTIGLKVVKYITISGTLYLLVASPEDPYKLTGYELGEKEHKLPKVTVESFAMAAGGNVGLSFKGIPPLSLGSGYVMYVYPAYVATGGEIDLNLLEEHFVLKGGLEGQLNASTGEFNIAGSVSAKVNIVAAGVEGEIAGVVSSAGIAGCGHARAWAVSEAFGGEVTVGIGHKWSEPFDLGHIQLWFSGSCQETLKPYEKEVSASQARAARRSYSVRIGPGVPSEMIKLRGRGGAPDVTITGPGGVHASSGGDGGESFKQPFLILRDTPASTTLIGIIHPHAGTYTITPNPGSAPVKEVLRAEGYKPTVRAHVTGHGRRRMLLYSLKPYVRGEEVRFAERGRGVYHVLGSASKAHGKLFFTPAPGPRGVRQIVAEITQNGEPVAMGAVSRAARSSARPSSADEIVLASYRAPGPRRLGRVRELRTRHLHSTVRVRFSGVPGARRYDVAVTLSDGARMAFVTRHHSVVISHVFGEVSGHVRVRALGDGASTSDGLPRSAPIRALARARPRRAATPGKHRPRRWRRGHR